jgi:hypothetical protein
MVVFLILSFLDILEQGSSTRGPPAVLKKSLSAHYITVCGQIDAPVTFPNYVYIKEKRGAGTKIQQNVLADRKELLTVPS